MKYSLLLKKINLLLLLTVTGYTYAQKEPAEFINIQITYHDAGVDLAGTLVLPDTTHTNFVVVVIMPGSERLSRSHYRKQANAFAAKGIAALIYDIRGVGESSSYPGNAPLSLLAEDAIKMVEEVKKNKFVDPSKIGLIGSSQSTWIAAKAASISKSINFVICGAMPVVTPAESETFRFTKARMLLNHSNSTINTSKKTMLLAYDLSNSYRDKKIMLPGFIENALKDLLTFEFNYDPLPDWAKVSQPTLIYWGDLDVLDPPFYGQKVLTDIFKKAGKQNYQTLIFKDADHVFKSTRQGSFFETMKNVKDTSLHVIPEVHQAIVDWIKNDFVALSENELPSIAFSNKPNNINASNEQKIFSYSLPWYGKAKVQLTCFIVFFLSFLILFVLFLIKLIASLVRYIKKKGKFKINTRPCISTGILLNLIMLLFFFYFIYRHIVFPNVAGTRIEDYHISVMRFLPLLGIVAVFVWLWQLVTIIKHARKNAFSSASPVAILALNFAFILYLGYWNMIGVPF